MTNNYEIKRIQKNDCKDFLNTYHYLGQQGQGFRSGYNYGLFEEGQLVGVCIFTSMSAWETVKGCFGLQNKEQKDFYELARFALDDDHHSVPNLGSWFMSQCIKQLRKDTFVRAIFTYADTEQSHVGYIYQATNFKYYGLTAPKNDFWILKDDGTYKKQGRGKTKGVDGEWRPRSQKHRYLMLFDKSLKVLWAEKPYPKRPTT